MSVISTTSFERNAAQRNLNPLALVVFKDGIEAAHHYWQENIPRHVFSVSKSLTSIGIGFAQQEGLLSLSDRIADIVLPREPIDDELRGVTIRDALMMATGQAEPDATKSFEKVYSSHEDWIDAYYHTPMSFLPGQRFEYNTLASYMLSACVQQVSGKTLADFLQPRLFEPLRMKPKWDTCPAGRSQGGVGLHLLAEEMARIGQFLLDEGKINGRPVLSSAYLRQAVSVQIKTHDHFLDKKLGYGYHFWKSAWVDSYRASGMNGQYIVILPRERAVIALQSDESENAYGLLSLIWETIAPQL